MGLLCGKQEPEDGGRGKRQRKSILTPQQLAGALDQTQSGFSSGSDFEQEAAGAAADGADSEHDSGSGDDDLVSEGEDDLEHGPEPDDDLIEDVVDAVRRTPVKRCAPAG